MTTNLRPFLTLNCFLLVAVAGFGVAGEARAETTYSTRAVVASISSSSPAANLRVVDTGEMPTGESHREAGAIDVDQGPYLRSRLAFAVVRGIDTLGYTDAHAATYQTEVLDRKSVV